MTESSSQGWQQPNQPTPPPGAGPGQGQPQRPPVVYPPVGGYPPPPPHQVGPGYQPQPFPPGYPPQPMPPQAGYSLPPGYAAGPPQAPYQPHPITKRIPDDLPLVVRNSIGKRAAVWACLVLGLALIFACAFGGIAGSAPDDGVNGFLVGVVVFAAMVVLFGGVFSLQLWIIASGGPVLAASPAGMWIKTRPTRGQAIWLPWEGIMQISRRRWSLEKMVVVKPRDPRATSNLGAYTAVDSSMLKLFYGSGFTATLNFADKPEAEIMAALAQLAVGRTAFV